jgi:hypothetical protein
MVNQDARGQVLSQLRLSLKRQGTSDSEDANIFATLERLGPPRSESSSTPDLRELRGSPVIDPVLDAIATEILDGYSKALTTEEYTIRIPANVTDVCAIRALNQRFRQLNPQMERDAVFVKDIDIIQLLPTLDLDCCKIRDYSLPRTFTIRGIIEEATGLSFQDQQQKLRDQNLLFADPAEQAIAAALHACRTNGGDFFKGHLARSSFPGIALIFNRHFGVQLCECLDAGSPKLSASGVYLG